MGRTTVRGISVVQANLRGWHRRKLAGLSELSSIQFEPSLETFAKGNRPWTDRTGNARRGLTANHEFGAGYFSLKLWHTVYYGVFLELGYAGRFSILEPTMRELGPQIIEQIRRYWRS